MKSNRGLVVVIGLFSLIGLLFIGCNCCKTIQPGIIILPEEISQAKAGDTLYMRTGFGAIEVEFYHGYEDQYKKSAIYIVTDDKPIVSSSK